MRRKAVMCRNTTPATMRCMSAFCQVVGTTPRATYPPGAGRRPTVVRVFCFEGGSVCQTWGELSGIHFGSMTVLCSSPAVACQVGACLLHWDSPPPRGQLTAPADGAMGRSCILDSPPGRWMPAAVRMPARRSRRFKGERPKGTATG